MTLAELNLQGLYYSCAANHPPVGNRIGIPELVFVDQGADSVVFRIDQYAAKLYVRDKLRGDRGREHLRYYQHVTNRASDLAEKDNWTISVAGETIPLRINTFDAIVPFNNTHWIGIAKFIEGDQVRKTIYDTDELLNEFEGIDKKVSTELGCIGVELKRLNTKVTHDEAGKLQFVVTDLCPDITFLSKR